MMLYNDVELLGSSWWCLKEVEIGDQLSPAAAHLSLERLSKPLKIRENLIDVRSIFKFDPNYICVFVFEMLKG